MIIADAGQLTAQVVVFKSQVLQGRQSAECYRNQTLTRISTVQVCTTTATLLGTYAERCRAKLSEVQPFSAAAERLLPKQQSYQIPKSTGGGGRARGRWRQSHGRPQNNPTKMIFVKWIALKQYDPSRALSACYHSGGQTTM